VNLPITSAVEAKPLTLQGIVSSNSKKVTIDISRFIKALLLFYRTH
jgi:hypothetical protein